MIVSPSLIQRRRDVPVEKFRRHWLDPQGVLAASLPHEPTGRLAVSEARDHRLD